jgi:hypothetical protein
MFKFRFDQKIADCTIEPSSIEGIIFVLVNGETLRRASGVDKVDG